MTVTLPIRLVSEANTREHWARKAKRAAHQRLATRSCLMFAWHMNGRSLNTELPVVVTLVRIAPRPLDGDNLQRAFKAVRDGVASKARGPRGWGGYFDVDDNDPRIEWRYAQERGKPKEYAVRIQIEAKETQP